MKRAKEFQLFLLWASLPPFLRMQTEDELKTMGIVGLEALDLLSIKTQKDFSIRFKISEHTLSVWNRKIDDEELKKEMFGWAQKLTSNVLFALYEKIMVHGDASRVKLWFQLVEGWSEKSEVVDRAASEEIQKQTEFMRMLVERR